MVFYVEPSMSGLHGGFARLGRRGVEVEEKDEAAVEQLPTHPTTMQRHLVLGRNTGKNSFLAFKVTFYSIAGNSEVLR